MAEQPARVHRRRRVSPIWLVPIVALLLGAWMVVYSVQNRGPEITIIFSTAEGIEEGATRIKARSVDVGLVERVRLTGDLERVVVSARLQPEAEALLRKDSQFWVVRPRIGVSGISGVGTLVSGAYIELAPGTGEPGRYHFVGLDDLPVTPVGTPGLKLTLVSDQAGSVNAGDPILFKGYQVGRVESSTFEVATQQVRYNAFIGRPYDDLVTSSTRFWNASGLSFDVSTQGIEVTTGSLESLLIGGVAFGQPEQVAPGRPVESGVEFKIYPDFPSVNQRPYRHAVEYVVEFGQSVRGLQPGAPVEYRGLRAGEVERVLLEELAAEGDSGQGSPIPVLIRLEPARLALEDSPAGVAALERAIAAGIDNGLRATLSTGSLLTGSLYVALDFFRDARRAELTRFADRPSIPTVATGLQGLEQQVTALLDKLNDLPLDDVTRSADATLLELRATVTELRALAESDTLRGLPASLDASLAELDRTLQGVDALARSIEAQPSSLIFPRPVVPDPEPVAPGR